MVDQDEATMIASRPRKYLPHVPTMVTRVMAYDAPYDQIPTDSDYEEELAWDQRRANAEVQAAQQAPSLDDLTPEQRLAYEQQLVEAYEEQLASQQRAYEEQLASQQRALAEQLAYTQQLLYVQHAQRRATEGATLMEWLAIKVAPHAAIVSAAMIVLAVAGGYLFAR